MAISFTVLDETIQLTDGDWRTDPFDLNPPAQFIWLDEDVTVDLDLDGSGWSATLDLNVIGDFNDDEEILIVTVEPGEAEESEATLFDDDDGNDGIFDGENTGPTDGATEINGVTNPSIGAQPSQGNVTINGVMPDPAFGVGNVNFTSDDVQDIIDNVAEFAADDSVELSGDLSDYIGNSDVDLNFEIADETAALGGVDFAQIEMEVNVSTEWEGKGISNVVFYLECDEEIVKIKIDDWDELPEEYTSTEFLDFSEETILDLAVDCGIEGDCDFVGMTIKAGQNQEEGFARNEIGGEGEIIAIDEATVRENYGKQNKPEWTVSAEDVIDDFLISDGLLIV